MNLAGITDWPGWGFWGIPIGVFVGAAGFWAARRYGDSGRRLFYWIDGTTGLVRKISHGIEVTHNGKPLKDPVLSKLVLEAPNRRDINEGDYSKARPLTFVFDRSYPFAQLYAPPRKQFVAIEPMTATVDALGAGTAPVVDAGDRFQTR